jgi:hypothetical protein
MWALVLTVLLPQGTQPSSKARCLGETYEFVSGLRFNGHVPFLVTHLKFVPVPTYERLQTEIGGKVFSKYICCTDSKIGKTPTDKGISKTYYVPVQRMAGTGYIEWGLHFFFLPLITFEVARVRGYLRKSEGSLPVKSERKYLHFCL